MKLFCFGFGYSAEVLADRLMTEGGWTLAGTRTRASDTTGVALAVYGGDGRTVSAGALLAGTTHVLVSIPPGIEGCPALRDFRADLAAEPSVQWIGYLSTIGVYGDHGGGWVDENTPARPTSERALRRWQAEQAWLAFGRETGRRVQVFRLPGIYGPGRSVIDALRSGTARRIVKPGQVFNRIHVADIAAAVHSAMIASTDIDLVNVTDDEPCPPQDVVAYGAELLGLAAPPEIAFEAASLSPMAQSFYSENKRVRNERLKARLGYRLLYPTYREGLLAIVRTA